jgi:hypothetical protein
MIYCDDMPIMEWESKAKRSGLLVYLQGLFDFFTWKAGIRTLNQVRIQFSRRHERCAEERTIIELETWLAFFL